MYLLLRCSRKPARHHLQKHPAAPVPITTPATAELRVYIDEGVPTPTQFGDQGNTDVITLGDQQLKFLDAAGAKGGRMIGQSTTRSINALFSFESYLPYDNLPTWKEFRALPLDEQKAR